MSIKIINDLAGFQEIKADWERLERQDQELTYYSTFRFNYSWWLTFGRDEANELFIICCYRDNELVGIAPLMIHKIDKKVLKCNSLRFIGKGDYLDFIMDTRKHNALAIIKEIFKAIEEQEDRWDKVELTHLAADTALLHYLLRHDKYNPGVKYLTSCPKIDISSFPSMEQFEKFGLNSRAKKKLEKLQHETGYRFKVMNGSESEHIYDRISYVHKNEKQYLLRERGRFDRRSLFEDQNNEEFYKRVFSNNKQVIVLFLEAKDSDKIIAYQVCYLFNGIMYGWNTGYDPEYAKYGVFDVLMLETIHFMFDMDDVEQFDLGAGSYPWKFRWTNQFTVNYTFNIWNNAHSRTKMYRFLEKARGVFRYLNQRTLAQ